MDSGRKQIIILVFVMMMFIGVVIALNWNLPQPVFSKTESDIDNTIIGDSATGQGNDGPAYMGANWAWPMPLALFNPVTSLPN